MISYAEALALILEAAPSLRTESVPLAEASGRFAGSRVTSPMDQPPFANSAMDGFALDTGGSEVAPGSLWEVAGRVAAGDPPTGNPGRVGGSSAEGAARDPAWEIMTGAPVPPGLDTVVPVEQVEVVTRGGEQTAWIRIPGPVAPGLNIRPAGKDFRKGDPVLEAGTRIGPLELMAMAALGVDRVPVLEVPGVAVISTGPELVDDPAAALAPGQIRNSNGPFLADALAGMGVSVLGRRTLGDDEEPFIREVEAALEEGAHLIVSTGAVSMGRWDFVPGALERLGAGTLFHRAAIRPGKPILAATLPGGGVFFGLPGNPISAAVGHRFFVHPLLRRLRGQGPERPWRMPLEEAARKPAALRAFLKARVTVDENGVPAVRVLEGQQSFRIAPLLEANAWVVLPEGMDEVPAGAMVDVHGLLDVCSWT